MKKKSEEKKDSTFFTDMLSGANGRISAKRVTGYIVTIVLLTVIVINTFIGAENTWLGEAFITMEVGGFALLGIGIFEKRGSLRNGDDKDDEDNKDF